ncbi:MAG TPA: leucyl aminopeptidase [Planctomycetota bacterium]
MRTVLTSKADAASNELVAILVPVGKQPELPAAAPPAAEWSADFGKDKGASVLLRGGKGQRWLLLRVPKASALTSEDLREAAGQARLRAEALDRAGVTIDLGAVDGSAEAAYAAAEAAAMAGYDPAVCKKDRKKAKVKKVSIASCGSSAAVKDAVARAGLAAEGNLFARELGNLPPNILFPQEFAKRARAVCAKSPRTTIKVHGRAALQQMKAGSLLGVSLGSAFEPQLVHMTYKPPGKAKGRVTVVGKGLTFDTGGISIKPSAKMDEMKFDMCGAAAVLGLFHALAGGHPCPYEVHGILGCVENMPGGKAQRPGDIVTAMNGTTIEVLNTDAEGRLVLADALTYAARKTKPDRIYDLATLTGAAIVALGHSATAILGNDDRLRDQVQAAGEVVGERCWPLPLWPVHKELAKGKYADLANIYPGGEGAGTIAGAAFLSYFVDDKPWVHLDIAATAWEGPNRSYFTGGSRGMGVRLLLELLRK